MLHLRVDRRRIRCRAIACALFAVAACGRARCGGSGSSSSGLDDRRGGAPLDRGRDGHVTFRQGERVHQIALARGAKPVDVSAALGGLSDVSVTRDNWINLSPDGQWLLLETNRFDSDCDGWACVVVAAADASGAEVVRVAGRPLRSEARGAIASGGDVVAIPRPGGAHALDVWVSRRRGDGWSRPIAVSGDSERDYNVQPAFSGDGARILFDCGPSPYSGDGTCVCEVGADGSRVRDVACPDRPPRGVAVGEAAHHADYAPDGSIVFEADWGGSEQVWRIPAGGGEPVRVAPDLHNDNSPCVLPDGRIVALWLGRPEGTGLHELTVRNADGSDPWVILPGLDIEDSGLGCGR